MSQLEPMTLQQWHARARELFGADQKSWRFKCPVCGHEASVADYQAAGAPVGAVAFSCVGRWIEGSREAFGQSGKGPCNYAGGGLFSLNPQPIVDLDFAAFAFAEPAPVRP
jgi:hypothetical protein